MSLSSDILPGGHTSADPVARSVGGYVEARFVKDVPVQCQRMARPVPTASPRLYDPRLTIYDSEPRSTINCSPIHFFTYSPVFTHELLFLVPLMPWSLVPGSLTPTPHTPDTHPPYSADPTPPSIQTHPPPVL